jgi:hypothetical protein
MKGTTSTERPLHEFCLIRIKNEVDETKSIVSSHKNVCWKTRPPSITNNDVNQKLEHSNDVNIPLRKPKGQSRMDNPETLATLGTQDTGRRQNKKKTKKTQHRRLIKATRKGKTPLIKHNTED